MSRDIDQFTARLKSIEPRLEISDNDLVELFWQAHPRFQFFKSLPSGANLLDIGAGDGGLVHWKGWLKPQRTDLNLYGVDRNDPEYRGLYASWETLDLDNQLPKFPGVKLNAFFASHLIEYLGAPEMLIEWMARRAEPGDRVYLEWISPASLDLPTREQLQKYDIDVVASNFIDDWEHKQAPDLARLSGWLSAAGFELSSSGMVDLGILGEELYARGAGRESRSMGYWSVTRSSLYGIAVKSAEAAATPREADGTIGTSMASAAPARPTSAAAPMPSEQLELLRTKQTLLVSGLFDAAFYRATYADIRISIADPLTHYIAQGEAEGRSPNPVFAPCYYRRHAMTGEPAERNALVHYAEEGERLGHKPHPTFEPQAYLAANPPLADFVDRPLFHFLAIGRAAGLPVALGRRGEALARILEAQPHAADFEYSERRNHYQLMRYKQVLVRELGVEEGFAFYKEMFDLPDSDHFERKPVASLHQFAKQRGAAFHEIAPAGEPFVVPAPRVIGEGNHRPLEGVSRAIFVACLIDARVRARSGFIDAGDAALLDYQGEELARIDDELDFDPAVFHVEDSAVWVIGPNDDANAVELDEAFVLLGPHSDRFGHWMLDLLPRYIAAEASGALPRIPVLIDEGMPPTLRQSLQLMLPEGVEIIALPSHATAKVRRLWCAPSQMHWPVQAKINERWKWDYRAAPPACFAAVIGEMMRRVEPIATAPAGPERVYLARRPDARHALVNSSEIEATAAARGFAIVYPEELAFVEQIRLLRHARFVIGPAGSQLSLAFFAQPGTKLCHLCHRYTARLLVLTGLLDEIGIDLTVLTGPHLGLEPESPEEPDYRIDPDAFYAIIDSWLNAEQPIPAGSAN